MKNRIVALFVIFSFLLIPIQFADSQENLEHLYNEISRLNAEKARLPKGKAKLSTQLRQQLESDKGLGQTTLAGIPALKTDANGRIHVEIRVTSFTRELHDLLRSMDFETRASSEYLPISANQHALVGWAPKDQLYRMVQLPQVILIREVLDPESEVGSVSTEGDGIHATAIIRSFASVDGSGETVGVISTGVDHLVDAQLSGDLPANVNVVSNQVGCIASGTDCSCPDGEIGCDVRDEGTAMLEIIHDIAPGAQLLFSDHTDSRVGFAQTIEQLARMGSTIIVDDIGWFGSPAYEDGVIAQTVDRVVLDYDLVYVTAAGNDAYTNYEAQFSDFDGNRLHGFDGFTEYLPIILRGERRVSICLHWNNQVGKARDDYALWLFDETLNSVLAYSDNPQMGAEDPLECLRYQNTNDAPVKLHIGVSKNAGADRMFTLEFSSTARGIEFVNPIGAIKGHQAAQHAVAVGAINSNDPGYDDIASYSSHGPSRVYDFDENGNPSSFFERNKPDLTAVDRVRITGAGQFGFVDPRGSDRWYFSGTSAAAPHVAATAALIRAADATLSATEVVELMKAEAVDLGSPGLDFVYGAGRIDAFAAVKRICPTCFEQSVPGGFINLSTRSNAPIEGIAAGFIVTGTTPRRFVIAGENISGMDPFLTLEDIFGNVLESNDSWQSHPSAQQLSTILGRALGDSKDAGFLVTLDPGSAYIARLTDLHARPGTRGIVAINDADGFLSGLASGELINLSTNATIPSGGMPAGFILRGSDPRAYVIAGENVYGMDPMLTLETLSGTVLEFNDNWRDHPSSGNLEAILGRPLNQASDAGFVVTLKPNQAYIARLVDLNGHPNPKGTIAINDAQGFLSIR